jgi:hypothetical protein
MKAILSVVFSILIVNLAFAQIFVGQSPQSCSINLITSSSSQLTDSLDVNNDGSFDLLFLASTLIGSDSYGMTAVESLNPDIEFSASQNGLADKFNSNDLISDQLIWRTDPQFFRTIMSAFVFNGSGNWRDTALPATTGDYIPMDGYMGFRLKQGADTLYGWVHVVSRVTDSFFASLSVTSFGIENITGFTPDLHSSEGIKVYPTISSNKLNVIHEENRWLTAVILNVKGEQISSERIKNNIINIEHLKNGFYFLNIITESGSFCFKFIKAD